MSKVFGIHFAAHDEQGVLHQFAPGDAVPGWVSVGDHCLAMDVPVDVPVVDVADESVDDEPAVTEPADVPDFTGAKTVRRARK